MFAACWSVKGGSGTTVVTAALGLILARSSPDGALLVDLGGDLPAVLGLPEPSGPGLGGWFRAGASVPPDALARLEVPVVERLALVPRGAGPLTPPERAAALVEALEAETRSVVIDCGTLDVVGPGSATSEDASSAAGARAAGEAAAEKTGAGWLVAAAVPTNLFVTRSCYLSLRRFVVASLRPSGIVLVIESGRALGRRDVEDVVGSDVVAEVPLDAAVARAVDAGLLAGRLPAVLSRALGRAL